MTGRGRMPMSSPTVTTARTTGLARYGANACSTVASMSMVPISPISIAWLESPASRVIVVAMPPSTRLTSRARSSSAVIPDMSTWPSSIVASGTYWERDSSDAANATQQHPRTTSMATAKTTRAFLAGLIFFSAFFECLGPEADLSAVCESACFARFFASYLPAFRATESIVVAAATFWAFLRTVLFELPLAIHTPRLRQTKSVDFTTRHGTILARRTFCTFCLGIVNETSWPDQAVSFFDGTGR